MALNSGVESENAVSCETTAKKSTSKANRIKPSNYFEASRNARSEAIKLRLRSKTIEGIDFRNCKKSQSPTPGADNRLKNVGKSETCINKNQSETGENEDQDPDQNGVLLPDRQTSRQSLNTRQTETKRVLFYDNPSETFSKLYREHGSAGIGKPARHESQTGRPSEIPKLRSLHRPQNEPRKNPATLTKFPLEGTAKEPEAEILADLEHKSNGMNGKKDIKKERIKLALKENFSSLIPLYEEELKKITSTWVNTIYCSLTMRANLSKLLFKILPNINRSQFRTEDEMLLNYIARAKSYTRGEEENLMDFIKLLLVNRNKAKDEYMVMIANKQIAESYNNNWKALTKIISDLGEETKQLQIEIPALEKKKEISENTANEKIRKLELNVSKKEEEIKRLSHQLNMLEYRENSYKGNITLKLEDYKDIKEEVVTLKCVEREFEELKAKYVCQNDIFEKKIKDLESLLEDKKKTLKKEKELKKQMQSFLLQLHTHEKQMYRKIGKDQVDFIMGRSNLSKSRRRDQLWVSAVKLVLKGFLVQMKKLERDRNKMLLELNSNDLVNYNTLATSIIQKDNFIKSIRHQMNTFQTAVNGQPMKTSLSSLL